MRKLSDMTEIHPNIFRSSPKCLYIRIPNGDIKYCSQDRFEKLMANAGNDPAKIVAQYRTRHTGSTPAPAVAATPEARRDAILKQMEALEKELEEVEKLIETPAQKRERLQKELAELEASTEPADEDDPTEEEEDEAVEERE